METMIQEFRIDDSNAVELVYVPEYRDYVVRYLTGRKFGHKTFTNLRFAKEFYQKKLDIIKG